MSCGADSKLTSGNQTTLEQQNCSIIVENNKKTPNIYNYDVFPKNILIGKQGKHILGHNNYMQGKSYITISLKEAQNIVSTLSGTGKPVSANKERIDVGRIIGYYVDPVTGKATPTSIVIIHYSNKGTHIVPARPKGE